MTTNLLFTRAPHTGTSVHLLFGAVAPGGAGTFKARVGGAWVPGLLKVRVAGAWVTKPLKTYTGGAWVTYTLT